MAFQVTVLHLSALSPRWRQGRGVGISLLHLAIENQVVLLDGTDQSHATLCNATLYNRVLRTSKAYHDTQASESVPVARDNLACCICRTA
jgi:hypothetical protein